MSTHVVALFPKKAILPLSSALSRSVRDNKIVSLQRDSIGCLTISTMNYFKAAVLVAVLSLADFGTTVLCVKQLGPTTTYTLFAALMLLGLLWQWRRRTIIKASNAAFANISVEERWQQMPEYMTRNVSWMIINILLLIPGLVTAGMAFLLMLPPFCKYLEAPLHNYLVKLQEARNLAKDAGQGRSTAS